MIFLRLVGWKAIQFCTHFNHCYWVVALTFFWTFRRTFHGLLFSQPPLQSYHLNKAVSLIASYIGFKELAPFYKENGISTYFYYMQTLSYLKLEIFTSFVYFCLFVWGFFFLLIFFLPVANGLVNYFLSCHLIHLTFAWR